MEEQDVYRRLAEHLSKVGMGYPVRDTLLEILKENLDIAVKLLERCHKNEIILEVEAGVVGGVEDGVKGGGGEKLYTTPEDMLLAEAFLKERDSRQTAGY